MCAKTFDREVIHADRKTYKNLALPSLSLAFTDLNIRTWRIQGCSMALLVTFVSAHVSFLLSQTEDAAASIPTATSVASSFSSWQDSVSERPPYSYMAMIQFAINSTEKKRMTLKDIYTWIEDHFPYFKHVAKPGWKVTSRPSSSCGPWADLSISLLDEKEKLFPSLQSKM